MTENWRGGGGGGEGSLARLKVQIILCTYCLEEGGMEALSKLDGGKGGSGVGQEKLVWRAGGSVGGDRSWLFQHRGSEVVALRLVL